MVRSLGRPQQRDRDNICDDKERGFCRDRKGGPRCVWRLYCIVRVQDWLQVGPENITTEKVSEKRASNDATDRAKADAPTADHKCRTDDEERGADESDEEVDGQRKNWVSDAAHDDVEPRECQRPERSENAQDQS